MADGPTEQAIQTIGKLRDRSGALAPLSRVLWGMGAAFVVVATHPASPPWALEYTGIAVLAIFGLWILVYLWMLLWRPDLLKSEGYSLRMRELEFDEKQRGLERATSQEARPRLVTDDSARRDDT